MPDAIYWAAQAAKDSVGILAGAYLIVQGHPFLGGFVFFMAIL
jgi:hypothetical protein